MTELVATTLGDVVVPSYRSMRTSTGPNTFAVNVTWPERHPPSIMRYKLLVFFISIIFDLPLLIPPVRSLRCTALLVGAPARNSPILSIDPYVINGHKY